MRDIALVAFVLAVLPFALRHTYIAVLLWTWISIMNPHRLAFGFAAQAPFAAIAAGTAFLSLVITRDRVRLPVVPPVVVLLIFLAWMCVTTIAAFYPVLSWDQLKKVLKIQVMTLLAIAAIQERKHIELFLWVNVLSIGFYGFKGGLFTLLTGGGSRVWGPPGGFIEGNNELAVALVITIPLMNYLRLVSSNKWVRRGCLALMFFSAIAALGTQSRGALLAITAMGAVLWIRSGRKLVTGLAVVLSAIALLAIMPESWEQRMSTIGTYQEDTSAMGRINAWRFAFNLANDRLFGGGFEIYSPDLFAAYAPNPADVHAAHSIYFSVLGEHGYVGLILFLTLWWLAFRTAAAIRRDTRDRPETQWLHHLGGMCQVALVGYAVGGAFLSLAYFDLPYNILVVLLASQRWLKEKRWQEKPGDPPTAQAAAGNLPKCSTDGVRP